MLKSDYPNKRLNALEITGVR